MRNIQKTYISKSKKGFTLSELLIVVAIIAVLVAVSIPIFSSQQEKSRRAVDMANARNIIAALSTGMISGDIEFPEEKFQNYETCAAVVVNADGMQTFISGSATVLDKSYDNSNGFHKHDRLEKYLASSGIKDYRLKSKDSSDGWAFYVVFLYQDGTVRVGSGTADDSNQYNDDSFEKHADTWKKQPASNIEKAMGIRK